MLSGKLLPVHPKPLPDELLTSWIVRVAEANGAKLHTLSRFLFGNHDRSPWVRDVARSGPVWITDKMAEVTGASKAQAVATTLTGYVGVVFSARQTSGQLRWLLPAKIRSSNRLGYSVQYCPECLAQDKIPYFRRKWRIGFYTFCPSHGVALYDCCPKCEAPIVIHRRDFSVDIGRAGSITQCHVCGGDMRRSASLNIAPYSDSLTRYYTSVLRDFENDDGKERSYDLDYYAVLHQLCKVLVSNSNHGCLREFICTNIGWPNKLLPTGRQPFEQRRSSDRYYVVALALWLMHSLEERLRDAWSHGVVRYNLLLKDFADPPCWYEAVVQKFNRLNK